MDGNLRPMLAELIGTFTLVFIGAGAGALAGAGIHDGGLLAVALAHGAALTIIVYSWGPVSGAHVNPAVTLGVAMGGKIDWPKATWYWIGQLVGGLLAGFLLLWLIGVEVQGQLGETVGSFTETSAAKTIVLEAVLTFFLAVAVLVSGVAGRNGNAYGVAIGLVLTADILMGGPLTGASMNPARTLGPAMAVGNLSYVWMYFVGPAIGGAVAGVTCKSMGLLD